MYFHLMFFPWNRNRLTIWRRNLDELIFVREIGIYLRVHAHAVFWFFSVCNFRTYEENGLLVYHHLNSEGFVKLFMEDARIKVTIVSADMPQVELDTFDQTYNDGKWHKCM